MSLGNHSSLMQSENLWRYSSSCYSKTTRRLIVNGVVRHLLVGIEYNKRHETNIYINKRCIID